MGWEWWAGITLDVGLHTNVYGCLLAGDAPGTTNVSCVALLPADSSIAARAPLASFAARLFTDFSFSLFLFVRAVRVALAAALAALAASTRTVAASSSINFLSALSC